MIGIDDDQRYAVRAVVVDGRIFAAQDSAEDFRHHREAVALVAEVRRTERQHRAEQFALRTVEIFGDRSSDFPRSPECSLREVAFPRTRPCRFSRPRSCRWTCPTRPASLSSERRRPADSSPDVPRGRQTEPRRGPSGGSCRPEIRTCRARRPSARSCPAGRYENCSCSECRQCRTLRPFGSRDRPSRWRSTGPKFRPQSTMAVEGLSEMILTGAPGLTLPSRTQRRYSMQRNMPCES